MLLRPNKHIIRNTCALVVFKRDCTFVLKDRGYWSKKENQRKCLDEAGKKLNVQKMDDWYNVSYHVCNSIVLNLLLGFEEIRRRKNTPNLRQITIKGHHVGL